MAISLEAAVVETGAFRFLLGISMEEKTDACLEKATRVLWKKKNVGMCYHKFYCYHSEIAFMRS